MKVHHSETQELEELALGFASWHRDQVRIMLRFGALNCRRLINLWRN